MSPAALVAAPGAAPGATPAAGGPALLYDECPPRGPWPPRPPFWATTLLALEVRWTPSPAQMLEPSTVVSSCKGDSSRPKNPSIFRMLASSVRSPAAAASVRHFSDPEISVKNSGCRPAMSFFLYPTRLELIDDHSLHIVHQLVCCE
jgi:hypothetical protein